MRIHAFQHIDDLRNYVLSLDSSYNKYHLLEAMEIEHTISVLTNKINDLRASTLNGR